MSTPQRSYIIRRNAIRRLRGVREFPVDSFADSIMPRNLLPEFLSTRNDLETPVTQCSCYCRGCTREGWWLDD